tara:strand:+ start:89 stop:202 length:114 start_codon:yes stop_codon:yes gene_type:complete
MNYLRHLTLAEGLVIVIGVVVVAWIVARAAIYYAVGR